MRHKRNSWTLLLLLYSCAAVVDPRVWGLVKLSSAPRYFESFLAIIVIENDMQSSRLCKRHEKFKREQHKHDVSTVTSDHNNAFAM